eukprot:gene7442-10140_t
MDMFSFLFICLILSISKLSISCNQISEEECPACLRVIRAARDLAQRQEALSATVAYEKYCKLSSLATQDEQFCYNTENIRNDIYRLINLGADEFRICKKIRAINPDFCSSSNKNKQASESSPLLLNERLKVGVIYM